jgi:hypothetical protein
MCCPEYAGRFEVEFESDTFGRKVRPDSSGPGASRSRSLAAAKRQAVVRHEAQNRVDRHHVVAIASLMFQDF